MKSKRKKRIGRLLTCCMFMLVGAASVSVTSKAETLKTEDGYKYSVNDDGTATIERYDGSETILEIPQEIDNHKVTILGSWAFSSCSGLTSITIPNGVTSIEYSAFKGCSSLTSITIPEGVTSIERGAFSECSSLTSITIPEGVTSIEDSVFEDCSNLVEVTLPSSIRSFGTDVFSNTMWLTNAKKNATDGMVIASNVLIDGSGATGDVKIPENVSKLYPLSRTF